jgi:predicted ATPase
MLTRLEVHGFKNLINFSVDFTPFTCIAGPNGVGKSNVFDAIRFLSLLADYPLMEAAQRIRGTDANRGSDERNLFWEPKDIFWTDGSSSMDELRLGAEMVIDENVIDDFGRPASVSSTFLRYDISIAYEEPPERSGFGRLRLTSEELTYISQRKAAEHMLFPHAANDFREHVIKNKRRGSPFISTNKAPDGQIEILVHQDGGSSGRPQRSPAEDAPRTIVATTNTSTTPTVLGARREMQKWRRLALEPTAMRQSDRFYTDPNLRMNGGHLPSTLHRLIETSDTPARVLASISNRLNELLGVQDIRVDVDNERRLLTLEVQEEARGYLPARSLSDGTLRFLTLCILDQDPEFTGLLCMEEPENGIHPARLPSMVNLLRDIAVDPNEPPGPENPLRQVIVATHSPRFVQLQENEDLLLAERVRVKSPLSSNGRSTQTLRCLPLDGTTRARRQRGVGKGSIESYLATPGDTQLTFDYQDPR